jgi:hypothetical protein
MIALVAAVLVGLASTALAIEPFEAPVYRDSPLASYAQAPALTVRNGGSRAVQPFTEEERALFERMGRPE